MSKLTRSAMKRVISALEQSHFTSAGFAVDFPDGGEQYVVITFLDDDSFFFKIGSDEENYRGKFKVSYVPGTVIIASEYSTSDFDQCVKSIDKWSQNVREEIVSAHPLFSEFEELRESVRRTIDERFEDETATFDPEEIEKLQHDLDDLAGKFQLLQDKSAITAEELNAIKRTVEELKSDAHHFPKKVWYRTAGNNFVKLIGSILDSKSGQKLLQEGTRNLLDLPGE